MATKVSGKKATGTRKRKERKNIERGAVHIQSTFNNTIVTITPNTEANIILKNCFIGFLFNHWTNVKIAPSPLGHSNRLAHTRLARVPD